MVRKKHIIYIIAGAVLVFMLSFLVGFIVTKRNIKKESEIVVSESPQKEVFIPQETIEVKETVTAYYIVSGENGVIKLSYVEDGEITELKTEEVSLEVLPKADINMLEEGIYAKTEDEAYKVWENFIS